MELSHLVQYSSSPRAHRLLHLKVEMSRLDAFFLQSKYASWKNIPRWLKKALCKCGIRYGDVRHQHRCLAPSIRSAAVDVNDLRSFFSSVEFNTWTSSCFLWVLLCCCWFCHHSFILPLLLFPSVLHAVPYLGLAVRDLIHRTTWPNI